MVTINEPITKGKMKSPVATKGDLLAKTMAFISLTLPSINL
jgi:hypothetical protein